MDQLKPVETKLAEVFKGAPPLPASAKKMLVQWWPYVTLVAGVLQLLSAWWLYDWGTKVNKVADVLNGYTSAFGVTSTVEKLNIFYWISLILLVVNGVIFIMAYPGLKARKIAGWNLMFMGALLNAVYGVFSALNNRGGAGSLISSLIGTIIGLYFLFQVKDQFGGAKSHSAPETK